MKWSKGISTSPWTVRILIQRPVGIRRDETVSRYRVIRDILSRFFNSRKYVSDPYSCKFAKEIYSWSGESIFASKSVKYALFGTRISTNCSDRTREKRGREMFIERFD